MTTGFGHLLQSLKSPFPNEHSFALNVCTIISAEDSSFKLDTCPKLLDHLLEHAGIYNSSHYINKPPSLTLFWSNVLNQKNIFDLLDETKFIKELCPPSKLKVVKLFELETHEQNKKNMTKCETRWSRRNQEKHKKLQMKYVKEFQRNSRHSCFYYGTVKKICRSNGIRNNKYGTTNKHGTINKENICQIDLDDEITPWNELNKENNNTVNKPDLIHSEAEHEIQSIEADRLNKQLEEAELYEAMRDESTPKSDIYIADEQRRSDSIKDNKSLDDELFGMGRDSWIQDLVGERILQIAHILRNFSFERNNIVIMGKNCCLIRFVLLCANSSWSCLHQLGFDMFANIAPEIHINNFPNMSLSNMLFDTLSRGITSSDRFIVISCFEILSKILQNGHRILDEKIYAEICKYLCLSDVVLLLNALECLYSLSSLGKICCDNICNVHGVVKTLFNLISIQDANLGPEAFRHMRIVETIPPGVENKIQQQKLTPSTSSGLHKPLINSIFSTPSPRRLRQILLTPTTPRVSQSSVASLKPTPYRLLNLKPGTANRVSNLIPKQVIKEESPTTKSIRITAALVLRNLVTNSQAAKRFVRCYQLNLTDLLFKNVEVSAILTDILAALHET